MLNNLLRLYTIILLLFCYASVKGEEYEYDFSDEKTGSLIYYNVTSDEIPLTIAVANRDFNYNSYKGNVTIPEKVFKGGGLYTVTSIWENAFAYCDSLTEVIFPESIVQLDDGAFVGCKNIKQITLPNKLSKIGNAVFYGCTSLETITLPASIKILGDNVFNGCSSLKRINIISAIPPEINGSKLGKTNPVISVPRGSSKAYSKSNIWNKYKIEEVAY
ncbi:MAG: leucine-rich repeat domain-containing protein [Bacteroidales bacterium]